jgi:hypothetical protein
VRRREFTSYASRPLSRARLSLPNVPHEFAARVLDRPVRAPARVQDVETFEIRPTREFARPRRQWGWIAALALGFVLRLTALDVQSFWYDEGGTLFVARSADMLRELAHDRHPPLSFLAFRYWIELFGESDVALRLLPALISCASLALFARVARRWPRNGAGTVRDRAVRRIALPRLATDRKCACTHSSAGARR